MDDAPKERKFSGLASWNCSFPAPQVERTPANRKGNEITLAAEDSPAHSTLHLSRDSASGVGSRRLSGSGGNVRTFLRKNSGAGDRT